MPSMQYRPQGVAQRIDLGAILLMLFQWMTLQAWKVSKEGLGLFQRVLMECFSLAAAPIMIPYTILSSIFSACQLTLRAWSVKSQRQGRTSAGAIGRALAQVLSLVNDLPNTSSKYPFARAVAEKILADNAKLMPPLLHINRVALSRAFMRSMQSLEVALHRERGSTWIGTTVQRIFLRSAAGSFAHSDADRADKLARELLWMADKMDECGGLEDAVWQLSRGGALATVALSAAPPIQKSLVRLAATLCLAVGNSKVSVPHEARFQLLYLWLPLFCQATQAAGPMFNSFEKQETEEAIQKAIVVLPPGDREVLFATWLHEYAWSSSDWPDLQKAYSQWCDLARLQATVASAQLY